MTDEEKKLREVKDELNAGINEIRDSQKILEEKKLDKEVIDKELQPKIDKVTAEIEKMEKAIDTIHIDVQQIKTHTEPDNKKEPSDQHKAFMTWVRKGILSPEETKVMKISDDTTGGYLASPEIVGGILQTITEYSPIRSIATVRTSSKESLEFITETNTFSANWTGEISARTETTGLTFGKERIPVHEAYARVHVTNWDLEDPDLDLESYIGQKFGIRFAVLESNSFVSGNTTYQPSGILTDANVAANNSGNATSIADPDAFMTMYFTPKTDYTRSAKWIMRRSTMALICKLKDNDARYLLRQLGEGPVWSILGSEVVECPDVPAVANAAYPVIFGDFKRAYQIVDRTGISILRDPFTAANTGTVIFHARKRVGAKIVMPEALVKMLIST